MRRLTLTVLTVLGTALLGGTALAAPACSVSTTPPALGSYSWLETTTGTGFVNVNCSDPNVASTGSVAFLLRFSPAPGAQGRELRFGSAVLRYNMYEDAGYQRLVTSTLGGRDTLDGFDSSIGLYFLIPSNQLVPIGTYQETLSISVEF